MGAELRVLRTDLRDGVAVGESGVNRHERRHIASNTAEGLTIAKGDKHHA